MPDHAKPSMLKDAYYWARAYAGHLRDETAGAWRRAWWSEVVMLAAFALLFAATAATAFVTDSPWDWAVLITEALFVGALLRWLHDLGRDREYTQRLLATEPTGAPRIANVRCSEGREHRFIYGPSGWQEAGPSVRSMVEELT
jgi:hypothetical protein